MRKNRGTLHYCLIQGLFWSGNAAVFVYASLYLLAQDFTNSQVGYIIALGSGLSAFIQPLVGSYADRSEKMVLDKLIISFSLVTIGLSFALLVIDRIFLVIALLYIFIITFAQVLSLLTSSFGLYFADRGIPVNFGIGRGIGSLTYAFMSIGMGAFIQRLSVNLVPVSILVIHVLLIVAVLTFPSQDADLSLAMTGPVEFRQKESLLSFLKRYKRFSVVLLGNILAFMGHSATSNYMYQIVNDKGFGSKELGVTIFFAAFWELPTLVLLNRINSKYRSGFLLKVSAVFISLRPFLLLVVHSLFGIYSSMLTHMLGFGLFAGVSMYYVNHTIERAQQLRGQSLIMTTMTIGSVLGSVIGGILLDLTSVPTMVLIAGIFAAIGAILIIIAAEPGMLYRENAEK